MKTLAKVAGVALVAGMVSLNSQAAPIYCSASDPTDSAVTSWTQGQTNVSVTLRVTDFTYGEKKAADDCYGVVGGNDSVAALDAAEVFGFKDWVFLTKFDLGDPDKNKNDVITPGEFDTGDGGLLSFSADYIGLSGGLHGYALNVTADPDTLLPAEMTLAGVIKQGNFWSAYLFSAVTIESLNKGTFRSTFGPGTNDFSHFTFYGRDYQPGPGPGPDPDPNPNPVPVPGTLVLLGLGLLGLGWSRKRRPLA